MVDDQGIIQFLKNQINQQDNQVLVEDDEFINRVESLDETIRVIAASYVTLIGIPKNWDDAGHTIANPLIYDGGGDNVWQ